MLNNLWINKNKYKENFKCNNYRLVTKSLKLISSLKKLEEKKKTRGSIKIISNRCNKPKLPLNKPNLTTTSLNLSRSKQNCLICRIKPNCLIRNRVIIRISLCSKMSKINRINKSFKSQHLKTQCMPIFWMTKSLRIRSIQFQINYSQRSQLRMSNCHSVSQKINNKAY